MKQEKREKKHRRQKRTRAKISGAAKRPRLNVFRTSKHIYAQLIDDEQGKTVLSLSDIKLKKGRKKKEKPETGLEKKSQSDKMKAAYEVGVLLAEKALEKKIEKAVFDRGSYKYHGRVKALAEGARKGGLEF